MGHKFALGASDEEGRIVGVVIVGRPVARRLDDGLTLEVTRCATDGTRNAASFLLGAAWRACRALGFRRLVTYTLEEEPGTSLRAAGFRELGRAGKPRGWGASRPRVETTPEQFKIRWEVP